MHQVRPCDQSLLPSTVSDVFTCVSMTLIPTHALKYLEKPRSAAHPSTSTASAGLLCLLLCALVHFIFSSSCELMRVTTATTQHQLHPIQLLASLGGCQLKPCSLKHEHKPASVVTRICKCGCGKVSREQSPLIPMGLPMVIGTDMQLA